MRPPVASTRHPGSGPFTTQQPRSARCLVLSMVPQLFPSAQHTCRLPISALGGPLPLRLTSNGGSESCCRSSLPTWQSTRSPIRTRGGWIMVIRSSGARCSESFPRLGLPLGKSLAGSLLMKAPATEHYSTWSMTPTAIKKIWRKWKQNKQSPTIASTRPTGWQRCLCLSSQSTRTCARRRRCVSHRPILALRAVRTSSSRWRNSLRLYSAKWARDGNQKAAVQRALGTRG
mmetsp:Transcript_19752/g.59922  ORF Transcript_19752/g.59922 Transcript_19752/m.59922 type:complete len:231 (+) Transcript_19752:2956-3648(+)